LCWTPISNASSPSSACRQRSRRPLPRPAATGRPCAPAASAARAGHRPPDSRTRAESRASPTSLLPLRKDLRLFPRKRGQTDDDRNTAPLRAADAAPDRGACAPEHDGAGRPPAVVRRPGAPTRGRCPGGTACAEAGEPALRGPRRPGSTVRGCNVALPAGVPRAPRAPRRSQRVFVPVAAPHSCWGSGGGGVVGGATLPACVCCARTRLVACSG